MSTLSKPPGKATYVASQSDSDWLRSVQRKLYTQSYGNIDYVFRKLWGFVTDARNLRVAFARVASNRGKRTAGVDRVTVGKIIAGGVEDFIADVRTEVRSGSYRPSPVRRVLIPKAGQPGKFRALGIPTVKDRVIQAAVKNILEPIFEAEFFPTSFGFRPGKSVHGALEYIRGLLRPRPIGPKRVPRLPYQWAIEGDIKACFDQIDHHALMCRIRRKVSDPRVNRLIVAFLKAGILSEKEFIRSNEGTPQGGILSPLLANIALSAIDERYARHTSHRRIPPKCRNAVGPLERAANARQVDRRRGLAVLVPVRYADDFIIFISVPPGPDQEVRAQAVAMEEKERLALFLKNELNLELSETKTLVTSVTKPMRFLGHSVRVRIHPRRRREVSTAVVPKEASRAIRRRIKALFDRSTIGGTLASRIALLNPLLRGWSHFYRHAWGAKRVFDQLDWYVWHTILRWLRKKHRGSSMKALYARYRLPRKRGFRSTFWHDGQARVFRTSTVKVLQYRHAWERPPDFAIHQGEPGA